MSKAVPNKSHARQSSGMSTTRMTSRQKGDMSSKHGTGPIGKGTNLKSSGGDNRIGADCRTFKKDFSQGPNNMKNKGY